MRKIFLFMLFYGIIFNSYSQIEGFKYFTKDISVNITNAVELTDDQGQTLDINSIYRVQLVTRGTGTNSGAQYIVWYNPDNSIWELREVNLSGTTSNYPVLEIESNKVKVKTNHASNYFVRVFVEELNSLESDVTPHIYGSAYQWQRKVNDLYYNDGNVGIGTNDPKGKLEIFGGGNLLIRGANNDAGDLVFKTNSDLQIGRIWTNTSGVSGVYLSSGDNIADITINKDGNVGIGTTTPNEKLEIANGNLRLRGSTSSAYGSLGKMDFFNSYSSSNVIAARIEGKRDSYSHKDGRLSFYTSDINGVLNEQLTINRLGNIGIGTSTPDQKLTVKGKIHTEEVLIDLSVPAPDYVFEKDYPIKSIEEVESYINKNKHLPEIPSANEFEKNGIRVGEMNMLLLQKIEELTLYMIEQNKRLNKVEAENKELKEEIKKLKSR